MGSLYVVFLTLVVFGVGEAAVNVRARCLSFQETMDTCLGPLGKGLGLRPGEEDELLSDLNTTKKLCQEGKLQDSMTCLEEVFNDCAEASKAYGYHRKQPISASDLMLDKGKWRNSMERLCDNIDYLQKHEECARMMAVQSSHCIKAETQLFTDKSAKVLARALKKGRTGHKQLMELGCQFAQNIIMCFQHTLDNGDTCPCHYTNLIVDIVMNSMPPFCKLDIDYYYYLTSNGCDGVDSFEDVDDNVDLLEDPEDGAASGGADDDDNNNNNFKGKPAKTHNNGKEVPGGSALQKGKDHPGEVVVIQQPGKGSGRKGKGVYKVQDVGQSQGQLGSGSASLRVKVMSLQVVSLVSGWMAVVCGAGMMLLR